MWKQIRKHFRQGRRLIQYVGAVSGISLMLPIAVYVFFRNSAELAAQVLFGFMLILMCTVCFVEANSIGIKDRRKASADKRYFFKGFIMGFIGQLPFWFITMTLVLIRHDIMGPPIEEVLINYVANFLTLQYFDVMYWLGYGVVGYMVAILLLPAVCMIGYMLSYANIDIDDMLGGIRKT